MKRLCVGMVSVLLAVLLGSAPGWTGEPLKTVEAKVGKILTILADPTLAGEENLGAKEEKIKAITREMFDYYELSRRTMSKNWKRLNPAQQEEFVDLYSTLLINTYMKKIINYTNQKVEFHKELELTATRIEVQSVIITARAKTPVNYRVIKSPEGWRVYDVVIEGISLVQNYRSQFKKILAKKSPEKLFKILRRKIGRA